MSIYSELSTLFKLMEELSELKEKEFPAENDIDDIKELSEQIIDSCVKLLSITNKNENDDFMRKFFIETNFNLLEWIAKNYCPQKKKNFFKNLYCYLNKKNIEEEIDINNNSSEKYENNNIEKPELIDNNTINIIINNEKKYNDKNKENNIISSFNSNNYNSTSISSSLNKANNNNVNNININNIINNEKEEEEYEEEDEEEEDDNNDIKDEKVNNEDFNKDNNNIIHINETVKEAENKENNNNDNEEEETSNEQKNEERKDIDNYNINFEEENIEEEHEGGEEEDESDNDKEDEEKLNEIINKPIKEHFLLYISKENQNKFNDLYIILQKLIYKYNKFNQKTKEKILTLCCAVFPFCSEDQKVKLVNIKIEQKLKVYLSESILCYKENDNIYSNILYSIHKKKDEKKEKKKYNKIKEEKNEKEIINLYKIFIKSDKELILLYQLLIIYKSFKSNEDLNTKQTFDGKYDLKDFYFISFKIYFILTHQELYPSISNNILYLYEKLFFIKKFYTNILTKKIQEPYLITKIGEDKYKFDDYILGNIEDFDINKLFDEDEIFINKIVMESIRHFYKIYDRSNFDLLYYVNSKILEKINDFNYNYIINLIELKYIKYNLIKAHNLDNYKGKLIRLEKNINDIIIDLNRKNKNKNNNINSFYIFKTSLTNSYNKLILLLKSKIKDKFKDLFPNDIDKIKFYPLITFLPIFSFTSYENDLYIYLDVFKLNSYYRKQILFWLESYLKEEYEAKINLKENNLQFEFKYEETNIRIIILGYPFYLNCLIINQYSLMDQRFPILVITLNHLLKKINLVNNSFLFYHLLIAFLQDIIEPPILPKILSYDNNIFNKKIPFSFNHEKEINNFMSELKFNNIKINKNIFDREKLKAIYYEHIKINGKNQLSCAEIFLYFLEFIIYYFKYDSIYVNFSSNYEGFCSMNNILNFDDDDEDIYGKELYTNDIYFKRFYKENFRKKKDKNIILIRDPVNPFYNHGSSLKSNNFKEFYDRIKKGYEILINEGSFEKIDIKLNKK